GIWISVSSRSKVPPSRVRISSASAPSCAVTVVWPSIPMARATRLRIESSSSAISTRGIKTLCCPGLCCTGAAASLRSGAAAGDVPLVEEAYVDIAPFRRRRREARLEPGAFTGLQHGLIQHRVPGIDLGAVFVAHAEAQPRQFDRLAGFARYHAFDHQHRLALDGLARDLDVLERQAAQVNLEA